MANSVPHNSALWLKSGDMVHWVAPLADAPRARMIDAPFETALRRALARSGDALTELLRGR